VPSASPLIALAFGIGGGDTHLALGVLDAGLAFEDGGLLADLLLAVQFGDAHRLLPLRFLDHRLAFEAAVCSPTFCSLSSWGQPDGLFLLAARVPISRSLVALATGSTSRGRPRPRRSARALLAKPHRSTPAAPPATPPCGQSLRCSPIRR